ncbi:MAG TPA: dodecin family protein [Nitrososphaeraceae archaeon]|nr:dodecin family protein [Nitrososphaeraceae archaeon]
MTSRREDEEEETGRKETSSSQGGRKEEERGQTATTRVSKIVEIVGTSNKSWEDAALVAIEEARKTIRGIRGIKIKDMTARVDPDTGRLVEYRTSVNLSFGVMDED